MSSDYSQSTTEEIARLREIVSRLRTELHIAEANLNKQMVEATEFEEIVNARLGPLSRELAAIEEELQLYQEQLDQLRYQNLYAGGYPTIDEQIRTSGSITREIQVPPQPLSMTESNKQQLRKLYHRLARRYHPDLAGQKLDERQLNEKMAILNEAYASGSLIEMMALAEFAEMTGLDEHDWDRTLESMQQALESELERIQRRKLEVQTEIQNLHNHPTVQLSLQIKLARLNGRNLLGEMAVELERQVELKTAERDKLQEQLRTFGSSPEKIKRHKQTAPLAKRIRARLRRQRLPSPIDPLPKES